MFLPLLENDISIVASHVKYVHILDTKNIVDSMFALLVVSSY